MTKTIEVLEQMGSDASLQAGEAIESFLVATELDTEIAEAICNKDITSLERQLDVCPDIVCAVFPAEDEEDEEGEEKDNDKDSTEETSHSVMGF